MFVDFRAKPVDACYAMKLGDNRVDPSELSEEELDRLQPILDFAEHNKLSSLRGPDGSEYPLPAPIFEVLIKVVRGLRHGKAILVLPEDESFTTQAAANYLGMSRQFFVGLLESGKIKFHRVGSHRRVYFKDLREYAAMRDKERRATLSGLFQTMQQSGHYDVDLSEVTDNAE